MEDFEQSSQSASGTGSAIKNSLSTIAKILKTCFLAIKKLIIWIGSALGSVGIYVLIFLAIVIVIMVVFACVAYMFNGGYNSEKGTMSSLGGVRGDMFYGTRFLYYDNETTSEDLKNVYLEFTDNLIKATYGTNISIDYNTEIETITLSFARELAKDNSLTLEECTKKIDHYGFNSTGVFITANGTDFTEQDYVLYKIADKLKTYVFSEQKEVIFNKLKEEYDKNFNYMKNVCAKILIKDYILDTEDAYATDILKKNYFGFVYMPKQSVVIKETNLAYVVDQDKTVKLTANYKNEDTITEIVTADATSEWFKGGIAETTLDCSLQDYVMQPFTAIDTSDLQYLNTEKTLFQILRDGKLNIYFKEGINLLDSKELLKNINTNSNYFYVEMEADSSFNMSESNVKYE